jgi:hypothetical protein
VLQPDDLLQMDTPTMLSSALVRRARVMRGRELLLDRDLRGESSAWIWLRGVIIVGGTDSSRAG